MRSGHATLAVAVMGVLPIVGCSGLAGDAADTAARVAGTQEVNLAPSGSAVETAEDFADVVAGSGFSDVARRCLARQLFESLSDEGFAAFGSGVSPGVAYGRLGDADTELLVDAINTCGGQSAVTSLVGTVLLEEFGIDLTEAELACFGEAMASAFGGAGEAVVAIERLEDGETIGTGYALGVERCGVAGGMAGFGVASFTGIGTDPSVAECMVDRLAARGTVAEVVTGQLWGSELAYAAIDEAALACDAEWDGVGSGLGDGPDDAGFDDVG